MSSQRPECQLISAVTTSEAVPDVSRQVGSEAWLSLTRTALRFCTAAQETVAAAIAASAACRMKFQQIQHPRQRDGATDCTIVDGAIIGLPVSVYSLIVVLPVCRRHPFGSGGLGAFERLAREARYDFPRMFSRTARSTTRSSRAIASGASPRYSPHASNSIFVPSAVDDLPFRAAMTLKSR